MPNFTFSSPDGKQYTITGPDGATPEQAFSILQQQIGQPKPQMGNAVTDVVPEIKNAASENIGAINRGLINNPQQSAIGGLLDTGRGLLAIPGLLASPITGAARSLLGHPLASAEHAIGTVINPQVAAQDNPQEMYESAKGGVDTAMTALAPRGASPTGMKLTPSPAASIGDLKSAYRAVVNDPGVKNIQVPPQDVATLSQTIEGDLLGRGFRPTNGSAPGTLAEVQRMQPGQGVQAVAIDDLLAARRALNMTAKQRDPIGGMTPDAVAARAAIEHMDNFLEPRVPELRDANANYAAAKAAETLDYRNLRSERRANKTGSGSNIENTMRQEIDKIPDRGLRPNERAARDQIVEGTLARNALRKVGKLGVSDGLSLMLHGIAAPASGGMSLPVAAVGTAARKLGELLTRGEIRRLNEQIRSRAPLSAMLPPTINRPNGVTSALASILLSQGPKSGLPMAIMAARAKQDEQ